MYAIQDIEKNEHHSHYILLNNDPVGVKPLSLSDIWRASKTWVQAFKKDSYYEYLSDGIKPNVWTQRLGYSIVLLLWYNNQVMFTAEHGAALNIDLHYPSKPRSRFDKLKDRLVIRTWIAASGRKTVEQAKRDAENREKMAACVKAAIRPERLPEMYQVALMATDPSYQGRGLGSSVLQAMTEIADKEGRACWLISSNVVNNGFYNANGFFTAGSYYLGDHNPQWTINPVQVQIMVREPKIELERAPSNNSLKQMMMMTPSSCFEIDIRMRRDRTQADIHITNCCGIPCNRA